LAGSATLVARTVTVCIVAIAAGAVYNPALEIVPVLGLNDQVTVVSAAFETIAVNCCVCDAYKATAVGPALTDTPPPERFSLPMNAL
jgi:hypothetical protein